jgi:hypothetical protein
VEALSSTDCWASGAVVKHAGWIGLRPDDEGSLAVRASDPGATLSLQNTRASGTGMRDTRGGVGLHSKLVGSVHCPLSLSQMVTQTLHRLTPGRPPLDALVRNEGVSYAVMFCLVACIFFGGGVKDCLSLSWIPFRRGFPSKGNPRSLSTHNTNLHDAPRRQGPCHFTACAPFNPAQNRSHL